jgi:hypothetical protein
MIKREKCRGYTAKGKRCTRNESSDYANGYCHLHQKQVKQHMTLPEIIVYVEPFGIQNLALERYLVPLRAHPWNVEEKQWGGELGVRLAKAPVELDRERQPGWLYFFKDLDRNPDFRKIGCTDRPLDVRMDEWRTKGNHPHLELVQCWHVPFHCQWWETTIFQVLKGVRYMMDRETNEFEPYDHSRRKGKEIEWFSIRDASGGEAYLLAICRTVIETLMRQLHSP